jgi:amino acid transporter
MTNVTIPKVDGVAGLKKSDLRPISVAFMLYCLVAAGAFGIEEMIPLSGPGLTLTMLFLFAFIWALPISSIVAEMGSVLPSEGGLYVWTQKAFGEFWGFQNGWWLTIAIYFSNASYVALIVGYASQLVPVSSEGKFMLKVAVILIFTIVNLMGIKEVSVVTTVLSVAILVAFSLVAIVGFTHWQQNPMEPFIPEEMGVLESIGGSICICVWMYCGYECISNIAGEVKDPQVIPKGLLIAMPIIALSYILPTLAGLASVGPWSEWSTEGGLGEYVGYASVLSEHLGPVFGYVFLVVAIISQCAIFNTYIAAGSRGFFVMADDNLFPKGMVKVSKSRGVPYIGVFSVAIVALITAQFDFTFLVIMTTVFMLAVYIVISLAILKLRKIYPIERRQGLFVVRGGKLGLYICVVLVISICFFSFMVNGTDYLLIGLAGMSSGPVFYAVFKIKYGGMAVKEPETYKVNPKTKLAKGDTVRISVFVMAVGAVGFLGQFFLRWYEGSWGEEYYAEEWGRGLLSNFNEMLSVMKYGGAFLLAIGIIFYFVAKKKDPCY